MMKDKSWFQMTNATTSAPVTCLNTLSDFCASHCVIDTLTTLTACQDMR